MHSLNKLNPWVVIPAPQRNPRIRIFCFPYAGGSSPVFREWPQKLPDFAEVCLVELPGRGRRLREPLHTDIDLLVSEMVESLLEYLDIPFVFFGHSMGALISYELSHYLSKYHDKIPSKLFVSGRTAPHLNSKEMPAHTLPDAQFLERIRELNGTPGAVLENAELMELMLPILRADFTLCETYTFSKFEMLPCPISIFGGLQDSSVEKRELQEWESHTSSEFKLHMLPGDHFFIHSSQNYLFEILNRELNELVQPPVQISI